MNLDKKTFQKFSEDGKEIFPVIIGQASAVLKTGNFKENKVYFIPDDGFLGNTFISRTDLIKPKFE